MNKLKALAAAVLVSMSAGAFAAAPTPTPLSFEYSSSGDTPGYFTSFSYNNAASTNVFTFDLTGFKDISFWGDISSTTLFGAGYAVASATLQAVGGTTYSFAIDPVITKSGKKTYDVEFAGSIDSGKYTLTVGGSGKGAVSGNLFMIATPVPEPESYALFLAGLGLMGAIAKRRASKNA